MATVSNPTSFNLYCHPLDIRISSGASVEVTEDEANQVVGSVFVVTHARPVPEAKPSRKAVTRGSKVAEVTEAPARETR